MIEELFGPETLQWSVQEKLDKSDEAGLIYWPPEGEMLH
jgi:hypothetical protein